MTRYYRYVYQHWRGFSPAIFKFYDGLLYIKNINGQWVICSKNINGLEEITEEEAILELL